jgi:hypothetical protein
VMLGGPTVASRIRAKIPITTANFNTSTTPANPSTPPSHPLDPSRVRYIHAPRWRPFAMRASYWARQPSAAILRKSSKRDPSLPRHRGDHVRLHVPRVTILERYDIANFSGCCRRRCARSRCAVWRTTTSCRSIRREEDIQSKEAEYRAGEEMVWSTCIFYGGYDANSFPTGYDSPSRIKHEPTV